MDINQNSNNCLSEGLLRQIELQQKAILNNIPDIVWLKDKESRFIAVNEAFAKACGLTLQSLVGKTDLDIWPLGLALKYRADDKEVMESGRRKCVEERLDDKEGKVKWIETIKTPIYNEGERLSGQPALPGILRSVRDMKKDCVKRVQNWRSGLRSGQQS